MHAIINENLNRYIVCCFILMFYLLGNAGGYLGLFLGYALLNVPELVQGACHWLSTHWNDMKNKMKM